ncbi:hypothetical protein L596_028598 [Steinernema carpocapsae]|uniref:Cysteine proteinase n=1 Tax=Steinernema carpocapsae TaxID=34508 RepID=A0A4U5LYV5_STECR|nr:hypothetical protein L596_028598 [Steinernema carpocapsae]
MKVVLLLLLGLAIAVSGKSIDARPQSDGPIEKLSKVGELGGVDSGEELHADAKKYAEKAVEKFNLEQNDRFHWKLQKLVRVHKQLVAGVKYTIRFVIAKTGCSKKDKLHNLHLCTVNVDAPKQMCTYDVYVREWENFEEYTNKGCGEHRDLVGGYRPHHLRNRQEEKVTMKGDKFHLSRYVKPKDFQAWNLFNGFIDRYNRSYDSKKEVLRRFRIYKRNLRSVKMWQENEQSTAEYGETQFSDMTTVEFRKTMLPYVWGKPKVPDTKADFNSIQNDEVPDSFDWRQKKVVTDVKNQGACGSCWAFSVTGNIEGQWALKKGKLVSLSEQELVDCDIVDQGCNGGLPSNAYKEIIRMGGLEPEDQYPYEGHSDTCHLARKDIAVYINDSVILPKDEGKMQLWLFKNGPISIGINATPLQFYRHGISHPWKIFCSPMMLNHGVLIVGYGKEGEKPFWIIKNSWGPKWGEQGYYRLYRGKNVCGVQEMATSALIS